MLRLFAACLTCLVASAATAYAIPWYVNPTLRARIYAGDDALDAVGLDLRAGALVADLGNTAATVWVSALDDQPVGSSKRLLAVHLTDLQNSGMRYFDRSRRILTDWGSLPHLMRRGSASVRIAAGAGRWRCYALSMGGGRRYEIPCAAEGETVAFKADVSSDPESATWLYELARE